MAYIIFKTPIRPSRNPLSHKASLKLLARGLLRILCFVIAADIAAHLFQGLLCVPDLNPGANIFSAKMCWRFLLYLLHLFAFNLSISSKFQRMWNFCGIMVILYLAPSPTGCSYYHRLLHHPMLDGILWLQIKAARITCVEITFFREIPPGAIRAVASNIYEDYGGGGVWIVIYWGQLPLADIHSPMEVR